MVLIDTLQNKHAHLSLSKFFTPTRLVTNLMNLRFSVFRQRLFELKLF